MSKAKANPNKKGDKAMQVKTYRPRASITEHMELATYGSGGPLKIVISHDFNLKEPIPIKLPSSVVPSCSR